MVFRRRNVLRLRVDALGRVQQQFEFLYDSNQTRLAERAGVNRHTVIRFLKSNNLQRDTFEKICIALELLPDEVGEEPTAQARQGNSTSPESTLDQQVTAVRQQVYPRIQHDCGTVRFLNLASNIDIDAIFIRTHFFKPQRPESARVTTYEKLVGEADVDNFDRFGFQRLNSEQISGIEAVNKYRRLGVFGKPGLGKTTYLHWIAIQCNKGELVPNQVPIFFYFKDYVEASGASNLQQYLIQYLVSCGVEGAEAIAPELLQRGRIFLIADGFDEVRDEERIRVYNQLTEFIAKFRDCRFVFSCRSPLWYQFPGFTNIIASEFNRSQIDKFTQQWFRVMGSPERSREFLDRLRRYIEIAELGKTPLLLALLCIVFEENGDFPRHRSDVYEEGLTILLSKWDEFRGVQRNSLYGGLSTEEKKSLLKAIATRSFIDQQTLLRKRDLEYSIKDYFAKVRQVSETQVPASALLKVMELQHGLIVQRASNYCSFSHLTFQEYFTASQLVETDKHELVLQHISDSRWRFVIELTSELLRRDRADPFFIQFKQAIDALIKTEPKICDFIDWINAVCWHELPKIQTQKPYPEVLLRAWFFALSLSDSSLGSMGRVSSRYRFVFPGYEVARSELSSRLLETYADFYQAFYKSHSSYQEFRAAIDQIYVKARNRSEPWQQDIENWKTLIQLEQQQHAQTVVWWESRQTYWRERVRKFIELQFNLRCHWDFSAEEKERLRQYYDATVLLNECMNRSSAISDVTYEQLTKELLMIVGGLDS